MRQLLFILTALTIHLTAFGQHDFGLKANVGLSHLDTKFHSNESVDKIYFQPSGQGGQFYNFHLRDKFLIGTELLFIQIEGKEYFEIPETDYLGNPTGLVSSNNVWRHISYFGVPIYFGYNLKRLNINLGFQTNFTLASSGQEKGQSSGGIVTWDNHFNILGIDSYDYGVRAGLLFKLTDKFSIETNYYYGINNILKDENTIKNWKWKVQQITIGLRYRIFSIRGQKSETGE